MKSPLLIIFGIASTLLGLYIFVISLFTMQETPDYHVGCYQCDLINNKAFQFGNRLRELKTIGDNSRNIHASLKSSQLVDLELRQKSIDLTKSVDTYIQKRALTKKYQESNINFFTQLATARNSYQTCTTDLKQNLDIESSRSLWTAYQSCFDKHDGLKAEIDVLYERRNKHLKEIDGLLVYDPNVNPNFDFEAQLRKIRERYERQNADNDKNKQALIIELKKLQQKNQTKSSQYDESERQFNRAGLQYDICLKNLKEFKKCQDISKALKDYGYAESVSSLEERIRAKRQMLVQMSQLLIQSQRDGGNNEAIKDMYQKRAQQLLQTMRLRLHMGYDEMKECGCTDDTRKKLESDLESAKMRMNLNKKQLNDLIFEIYSVQRKIKETDQLREKLIKEFTEETQRLRNREISNILSLKERLEILRANLETINQEIYKYNRKLSALDFECNQYKERLGIKIKDAEAVAECLKSRDFYNQLKSKADLILRKEDETTSTSREPVRKSFWAITYPDTVDVKRMVSFRTQIDELRQSKSVKEPNAQEVVNERTLEKEVITVDREIIINAPDEKITIHEEQVIVIDPTHNVEL